MKSKGSALITVIWILSLLAVFSIAIYRRVSVELFLGQWVRNRTIARIVAKAGIERALYEIVEDEFPTFDGLNDSWASNDDAFKEIDFEGSKLIVSCDALGTEEMDPENPPLFGACDESGKLNLNTAPEAFLQELFSMFLDKQDEKEAMRIAQSIMDWRDEDDAVMPFGAEANFYKAFPDRMLPRNSDLKTIEELLMIKGVTPELYEAVRPYVTVYSKGKINFNTASEIVMRAVGLSEDFARKIALFRRGEDELSGTDDDNIFQLVEGISPGISQSSSFSPEEFAQISNLTSQEWVSVQADTFRIRSIGRFIRRDTHFDTVIECVVTKKGQFLYWSEKQV